MSHSVERIATMAAMLRRGAADTELGRFYRDVADALESIPSLVARAEKAEALVERAFRDGVAYATNVNVRDADLAWEQSQVRAALKEQGQ